MMSLVTVAATNVHMIPFIKRVISSDSPSILQAYTLMAALSYQWKKSDVPTFTKRVSSAVNIWLRDLNGRDLCVNQTLAIAAGMPAESFVGLTYESSGIDPHLVEFRKNNDGLVLQARAPMIFIENSTLGDYETITIPIQEDDGVLLATAHIAMRLDR
jgi:alkylhydroperoxidase family enzyme